MTGICFLKGERVILRPLEREDIDGPYPSWLNDQDGDQFTEHAIFPRNHDDIVAYYQALRGNRSVLHLAIFARDDGRHVGNVCLQSIDWISRHAEFAILLGDPTVRRKGYGLEAACLILAHGFKRLNLRRVWLGVNADNTAALALYHRLGFHKEGRMRQHILRAGGVHDVILMGLLAGEFQFFSGL